MSTLSLRLPESLHRQAKRLADEDGVSVNQLISLAVAEKIAALDAERHLAARAARGRKTKFRAVLAKVPAVKPAAEDTF
jgi:hypothetical protein